MKAPDPTIGQALRAGARQLTNSETAYLDVRVLMKSVMQYDDADIIVNENAKISGDHLNLFNDFVARRAGGEPVAYIVGTREFWGMTFEMTPGVLVPRPDSEVVVELALELMKGRLSPIRILELGVGSGALVCALLHELPDATAVAIDRNPRAVELTRKNANLLQLDTRLCVEVGDWDELNIEEFRGEGFDLIISNPPYIPAGDASVLSASIMQYEDHDALFAGPDGRAAYSRILRLMPDLIRTGGRIVLEIGDGHADWLQEQAKSIGASMCEFKLDLQAVPRAIGYGFD